MDKNQTCQLPKSIISGAFASMFKQYAPVCQAFFSKYNFSDDLLANLNTTLAGNGFFLFVPANTKRTKPIKIANLFDGRNDMLIQTRNLIMMEAGSSINLFINDQALMGESFICNNMTVVALGNDAHLEMVRRQKMNSASRLNTNTIVQQAASSRMKTHYITLSGNIHNNLKVTLSGQNAEHVAAGLSTTQQTEHVDNDILMIHESPDC